jgi:hypothetical protein
MANLEVGTRVWVRRDGTIDHGVIARLSTTLDDLGVPRGAVTIVLDIGTTAVATTTESCGTLWGFADELPGG